MLRTIALLLVMSAAAWAQAPMRFQVTLAPEVAEKPVSGRLIVFMTAGQEPGEVIEPSILEPSRVWMEAIELHDLAPGKAIEVSPTLAYPKQFAQAEAGDYRFQAVLDINHNYAYSEHMDGGDLYSEVVIRSGLNPGSAAPISLQLSERAAAKTLKETETLKLVSMRSAALTKFWGRPIRMNAVVQLPPSYAKEKARRYPTVYVIHGYGWTHIESAKHAQEQVAAGMASGKWPEMVYVYLDGSGSLGHHEFANSVNNGPWGEALIEELIPHLEKEFRLERAPAKRFLTGHSSGGWSSLWLQVRYPDEFGGTWSTSPDPEDFRSFTDIDLLRGDNFYRKADGTLRNLVRWHGKNVMSMYDFVQYERVLGDYGGQIQSFEAVFSPRGEDGRPMEVFDRETGEVDPAVAKAWEEKYDIGEYLRKNWARIGPKLNGKIHVWVGTTDNFHLDDSARLLDKTLKELGSDAKVTFIKGRDHFDLYQDGLADEIARQMGEAAKK